MKANQYNPDDHPIEIKVGSPSKFITELGEPIDSAKAQRSALKKKYRAASGNPSTKQ